VQGVGYRWWCQAEARRLGVTGWVRNEPDESVSGHFEGPADAVAALVDWCGRGPEYAQVRHIATAPARALGSDTFEIRY
jgi:acylphosphatase